MISSEDKNFLCSTKEDCEVRMKWSYFTCSFRYASRIIIIRFSSAFMVM